MASEENNRGAFLIQEHFCRVMDAPITARVCAALAAGLTRETRSGARILDWPGEPTADALPLRTVGGLHALELAGVAPGLAGVFKGSVTEPDAVQAALSAAFAAHDDALYPWLDGPPQTNEPARSAALMTGLIEVARRHGPTLELLEIGSSAGLNLLIDRYRFDLGGTVYGPVDAPVTIRPDWRGAPPPAVPLEIASVCGTDINPVDVSDPAAAARLKAYIWADQPERAERLDRAIAMIAERPVRLDRASAEDWLAERLPEPQAEGVTRVVMHSVVWQYLGAERQAKVAALIEGAGAAADAARPFAWVRMEPDRVSAEQVVWVSSWPGDGEATKLASVHAHGAWVMPA